MPRTSKAKLTVDGDTLRYNFTNDKELTINLADIPAPSLKLFTLRGVGEKIRDSYAGIKDVDSAFDVAQRVIQAILDGKTSIRIAGKHGPRLTMLAEALSRYTKGEKSVEECQAKLAEFSDEQLDDLRSRAVIQMHMAAIRAENAKQKMKNLQKEAKAEENEPLPGF